MSTPVGRPPTAARRSEEIGSTSLELTSTDRLRTEHNRVPRGIVPLTDTPDGRQRFQDLASIIEWEQSRLSHQIARMTKRGLVTREECAEDGRGAFVAITPAGRKTIEAAAFHHVATVRRLVIDALSPDELATFARLSNLILEQLDNESP
ncbi:MarR family winged helix-turn-helix transcriptional regulator [Streptomyces tailanensis]|uniref:MarR family winged helix-turn-helix transcriptional regulator n=1 Tax=Streptomyces tailanensis TaxID=2569858 RepID=UPI00122E1616|nr:MarR family winged helix-turn-helix transcriptional regulator [Streptomyces tailanensis]